MPRIKNRVKVVSGFDRRAFRLAAMAHNAKSTLDTFASAQVMAFLDRLAQALEAVFEKMEPAGRSRVAEEIRQIELPSSSEAWEWATVTAKPTLLAKWGEEMGAALLPVAASFYDFSLLVGADYALRTSDGEKKEENGEKKEKKGKSGRAGVLAVRMAEYKALAGFQDQVLRIAANVLAWQLFA